MRHQIIGSRILALLMASFLASPSLAQGFTPIEAANLFGTEHGDAFTSIFLNQIFGPIFPSVTGDSTATVFSTIIGYFNVIILVIGGILFAYNATIGLLQSAHEGRILGQRWSSLWAPLRVVFAVGLLVPVPGLGGYNLVQSGVAYVVKGSTNIATAVWTTAAELTVTGRTPITTAPATIPPGVIRTLYSNAACEALVNHQMAVAAGGSAPPYTIGSVTVTNATGEVYTNSVLMMNGRPMQTNICGYNVAPAPPAFIQRSDPEAEVVIPGIQGPQHSSISSYFTTMHQETLSQAMTSLRAATNRILPEILDNGQPIPDVTTDIETTTTTANERLAAGVQSIMDAAVGTNRRGEAARQALLNRIRGSCTESTSDETSLRCYGEGWIGAGSWYMMFARLNNEMASLFGAQASAGNGVYLGTTDRINRNIHIASGGSRWRGGTGDMIDETGIQLAMDRYMESFDNASASLVALGFPMSNMHLTQLSDDNPSSLLDQIPGFAELMTRTRNYIIEGLSPGNRFWADDPMVGMSTLGQFLINLAGVLLAAATVTGFLTGGGVATMIMPLFVALITAGSLLHMLLPIMPFIFWILAVTGYFILVVEAMIAVNLWALAHMRMDGEGISGEAGRQGWLMLLALLMTPVLMVFGFLIGMTIFRVTSALLDIGITQALSGILGSSLWINLIAIVGYSIFMSIFYMVLLERSFSLVSEFPGRVLRWMGAGAQLTNGEEGKARMAAAGAGLAVAKGASMPAGAAIRGAGAAGVSRGGASGHNPGNDPARWGAARRGLDGMNTTDSSEQSAVRRRIGNPLGRAAQRLTGTGSFARNGDDGNPPPRASS